MKAMLPTDIGMETNPPATEFTDNEWIDAVAAAMRQLDPQLQPELALDAAKDPVA